MPFPENLGTVACSCVVSGARPVLFVSHCGGDWQMYCHWRNHDFDSPGIVQELQVVHVALLVRRDPGLEAMADLPTDMAAERTQVGGSWEIYEDKDD